MAKIVSLRDFKEAKESESRKGDLGLILDDLEHVSEDRKKEVALEAFREAERRNAENAVRLKKERLNANKSVLRSYRIKN